MSSSYVKTLKQKFEELDKKRFIEPLNLDITSLQINKKEPKFNYQRSATCISFNRNNNVDKEKVEYPKQENQTDDNNRFQRHCQNSSGRSIRRSPAFRLDQQDKPNYSRNVDVKEIVSVLDEAEYLKKSDTIRRALLSPLPKGPPPKKPPRTFEKPIRDLNCIDTPASSKIEQIKRNFQLHTESQIDRNKHNSKKSTKFNNEKRAFGKLFGCIVPCHDPIYYERINSRNNSDEEQIYMEPYEHLKNKDWVNNHNSQVTNNSELHYMYTVLNPNPSESESNDNFAVPKNSAVKDN